MIMSFLYQDEKDTKDFWAATNEGEDDINPRSCVLQESSEDHFYPYKITMSNNPSNITNTCPCHADPYLATLIIKITLSCLKLGNI